LFSSLLYGQYTGGSGDGFAVWTSAEDIPLPVKLLSYAYSVGNNAVIIEWETSSEIMNMGFVVKRKYSIEDTFKVIASYSTNKGLCGLGSSSQGKKYRFYDTFITPNSQYTYQVNSVDYNGNIHLIFQFNIDIPDKFNPPTIANKFELRQNYPNPFNPTTTIPFQVNLAGRIKIAIFNVLGQHVVTLTDRHYEVGKYSEDFTLVNTNGSGIYICKIESGGTVKYLKMTAIK